MTRLLDAVGEFWFNNFPGKFDHGGKGWTRQEIQIYGGPSPEFDCTLCQAAEWLSRLEQKNMFMEHKSTLSLFLVSGERCPNQDGL